MRGIPIEKEDFKEYLSCDICGAPVEFLKIEWNPKKGLIQYKIKCTMDKSHSGKRILAIDQFLKFAPERMMAPFLGVLFKNRAALDQIILRMGYKPFMALFEKYPPLEIKEMLKIENMVKEHAMDFVERDEAFFDQISTEGRYDERIIQFIKPHSQIALLAIARYLFGLKLGEFGVGLRLEKPVSIDNKYVKRHATVMDRTAEKITNTVEKALIRLIKTGRLQGSIRPFKIFKILGYFSPEGSPSTMVKCESCGKELGLLPSEKSTMIARCENCRAWCHLFCVLFMRTTFKQGSFPFGGPQMKIEFAYCPLCYYEMKVDELKRDKKGALIFKGKPFPPIN